MPHILYNSPKRNALSNAENSIKSLPDMFTFVSLLRFLNPKSQHKTDLCAYARSALFDCCPRQFLIHYHMIISSCHDFLIQHSTVSAESVGSRCSDIHVSPAMQPFSRKSMATFQATQFFIKMTNVIS